MKTKQPVYAHKRQHQAEAQRKRRDEQEEREEEAHRRAIAEGAGRRKERRVAGIGPGAASADHGAAQPAFVLAVPGVAGFERLCLGKLRFSFGEY